MKMKWIPFLVLFFSFLNSTAQIPNAGFEDWTTVDSIEQPLHWETNNIPGYISVTKTDDALNGDYAMELTANLPTIEGNWPGTAETSLTVDNFSSQTAVSVMYKCLSYPNAQTGRCQLSVDYFYQGAYVHSANTYVEPEVTEFTEMKLWSGLEEGQAVDSIRIRLMGGSIITPLGQSGNAFFIVDDIKIETTTSTVVPESPVMEVFPNPVGSTLQIKGGEMIGEVGLFDGKGTLLQFQKVNATELELEVHQLLSGVYFLQLKTKEGVILHKKVVVQ